MNGTNEHQRNREYVLNVKVHTGTKKRRSNAKSTLVLWVLLLCTHGVISAEPYTYSTRSVAAFAPHTVYHMFTHHTTTLYNISMGTSVKCIVTVTFKDDKTEKFECCDTPNVGGYWLTIYPYQDPTSRKFISMQRVSEIEYRFTSDD